MALMSGITGFRRAWRTGARAKESSWTGVPTAASLTILRYWWVNQNQTYRQETEGGYLWSPKRNRNGGRNPFYDFMRAIAPGDVVFSFADTWIRKIGIAESYCFESPQPPEFGAVGRAWDIIGWRVRVRFFPLERPIKPKDYIGVLTPLLPSRLSPLRADGGGNQVYLASIPEPMAIALGGLIGPEFALLQQATHSVPLDEQSRAQTLDEDTEAWERHLLAKVENDGALTPTQRTAIVQARVGQGLFRQNLCRIEKRCRVTGVCEPAHLRASHTKPWRSSNDEERLSGENGLLLTPTIDHLFDRGFISFEDDGDLLVSPIANRNALSRMGVACDRVINVGSFSAGQRQFLEYHREFVFLSTG